MGMDLRVVEAVVAVAVAVVAVKKSLLGGWIKFIETSLFFYTILRC